MDATDGPDSPRVAVVNRVMADTYWRGGAAVGRRFRLRDGDWITVIGVSGNVRHDWFINRIDPTFYVPMAQAPPGEATLVLRSAGDPLALAGAASEPSCGRSTPTCRSTRSRRCDACDTTGRSARDSRRARWARSASSACSLRRSASTGSWRTPSSLRTHEIGVRMALGASRRGVMLDTIRRALALTGIGLGLGLVAAYALGRAMEQLLFGTVSLDVVSFVWLSALLVAVAVLASVFPAHRATRVDPMVALRGE